MIFRLPIFFAIAVLSGVALLGMLWPRSVSAPGKSLKISLGFGLGMGAISFLQFFWLLGRGAWSSGMNMLLIAWGLAAMALVFFQGKLRDATPVMPAESSGPAQEIEQILAGYFWVFLAFAVLIAVFYFYQNPHGNWDAWSHWNLRARFVFRGGEGWNRALGPDYWNPLNYPLFLPMLVSSGWGFITVETQWVPGLIALGFTLATVFLLQGGLSRLRGRAQGLLAGILLLGTPFFLNHGNSQYSDMLFIACFGLTRFVTVFWEKGWKAALREAFVFGLGLLPVLAVDFYVKTRLYPPATIFQTRNVPYTFVHFTEWIRYKKVVTAYVRTFFQFGEWGLSLPAFLIVYFFWMKSSPIPLLRWMSARVYLALAMMLGGYFMVYLATPHDVDWLLRTSVQRLFLCLWPSLLFAYFLGLRTPEEVLQTEKIGESSIISPIPSAS
ncbi:MAG: hypothetical protein K8R69_06440 [Deltaproteobacteria bacterium]|nr:hypothetical protein [Deltaproteobacteria bacterium]